MISMLLSQKGKGINFKYGSAISRINTDESSLNEDLGVITKLYLTEATIFMDEMRNVVSPTIKAISDLLTENFDKNRVDLKPKFNINIIGYVELFEHLKDEGKLNVVGSGILPKNLMIGFPLDEVEDDMKSYFLTGDNELDNMVYPIINKYTNDELRSIWNKYMLDFSGMNTNLTELEFLHFRNSDNIVLIYMALKNIFDGKIKYTLNSDVLNKNIVTVEDFIKTIINKYNQYISLVIDKQLVINYNFEAENNRFEIFVSNEQYESYFENEPFGVDAIVGFVIDSSKNNGDKSATYERIVNNGENFINTYKNNYKVDELLNARKNLDARKTTVKVLGYNYLALIKTNFENNKLVKADLEKEAGFTDFLLSIDENDLDNTMKLATKIVSYFNSEISEFIDIMEAQLKFLNGSSDENMTKEAALYAVIVRLINKLFEDVDLVDVKVD